MEREKNKKFAKQRGKKKLSMGGWCMGGRKNKTEQG